MRTAAAVATIILLPGAAASSECSPAVRDMSLRSEAGESGWTVALLLGLTLFVFLVAACCFMIGTLRGSFPKCSGHQKKGEEKETQTHAIVIRRYWDEPRDLVISEAIRRGIPGASRPRATRAELASLLIEQDLGRCFDRSQG